VTVAGITFDPSEGAAPPPSEPGAPVTPVVEPPRARGVSAAQLTVLVVCCVSIYFVIAFYGKSLDSYRLSQRANAVRRENARLEAQIKDLQERVAFYATESYLETTAREKLNLVKPGDRPIVILPAQIEVATVEGPPPADEYRRPLAELGHAADWLFLFFGNR
jgi:cell division protein DivIC